MDTIVCVCVLIFVEALGGIIYLYLKLQNLSRGSKTRNKMEERKARLSHAALLSSHCLGNSNKYKGCPKHFATLSTLHAKL
jgi:hypothetical protein